MSLMTLQEVAEELRCERHLASAIVKREIPHLRSGRGRMGRILVERAQLDAYLRRNTVYPDSAPKPKKRGPWPEYTGHLERRKV